MYPFPLYPLPLLPCPRAFSVGRVERMNVLPTPNMHDNAFDPVAMPASDSYSKHIEAQRTRIIAVLRIPEWTLEAGQLITGISLQETVRSNCKAL